MVDAVYGESKHCTAVAVKGGTGHIAVKATSILKTRDTYVCTLNGFYR